MYKFSVYLSRCLQICGKFWDTQYVKKNLVATEEADEEQDGVITVKPTSTPRLQENIVY